jgi:cell wall assembly regulator SMI1
MEIEASWERIVAWCLVEAPQTLVGLRPPATAGARERAESATGGRWPDDLRRWYGLHDGVDRTVYAAVFPGHSPLPVDEVPALWEMHRASSRRLDADAAAQAERDEQDPRIQRLRQARRRPYVDVGRPYDIGRHEGEPAGSVANMFLPSYVPFAENSSGWMLFVDTRPGPRSGCVTAFRREDTDLDGPRWPSLAALVEDVAGCLEDGRPTGYWRPVVTDGLLDWEIVVDRSTRP